MSATEARKNWLDVCRLSDLRRAVQTAPCSGRVESNTSKALGGRNPAVLCKCAKCQHERAIRVVLCLVWTPSQLDSLSVSQLPRTACRLLVMRLFSGSVCTLLNFNFRDKRKWRPKRARNNLQEMVLLYWFGESVVLRDVSGRLAMAMERDGCDEIQTRMPNDISTERGNWHREVVERPCGAKTVQSPKKWLVRGLVKFLLALP